MTDDVARLRLANQQITVHTHTTARDVVAAFGAMQAQEYRSALWAVGVRLGNATQRDVEQPLASAAIVRTWALRGTLHLVAAEDVRWILDLVGRKVVAGSAGRLRQLGIGDLELEASRHALEKGFSDGGGLTRSDAFLLLERAGIATADQRGIHILQQLSLKGLLVQTAFTGRQTTFALLDAVIPGAAARSREEALAELAWRYFSSHGPATLRDFAWWSGLGVAEARAATELATGRLTSEKIGDAVHWMPIVPSSPGLISPAPAGRIVHVLPGFDEYILGYQDRRSALSGLAAERIIVRNGVFRPAIVADGRAIGTWRPGNGTRPSSVAEVFSPFDAETSRAVRAALDEHDLFVGRPVS